MCGVTELDRDEDVAVYVWSDRARQYRMKELEAQGKWKKYPRPRNVRNVERGCNETCDGCAGEGKKDRSRDGWTASRTA